MGLPHQKKEDRENLSGRYPWAHWTRAMRLVHLTIVGVSFWSLEETSSGHAVIPKEREPRHTPRSPAASPHLSVKALECSLSVVYDGGTTWDLVGQVFSPFSPGDPTMHPVCPLWILVHPTERGWSPNSSASDAFGS